MQNQESTSITPLKIRKKELQAHPNPIQWEQVPKRRRGESFMKNLAVSGALVLCAVTLRAGAIPSLSDTTDVVLTAATDQSLLDDQLGKLSFVSALFPEAVLVFGENHQEALCLDIEKDRVVHAWSAQEPYTAWHAQDGLVYSACEGEVIGVYHGNGDERLVQVMSSSGLACLYGNLEDVLVEMGDQVNKGTALGVVKSGDACVLEVREDGRSIDPAPYLIH